MNSVEHFRMTELESTHWWYRSLHHLVMSSIMKYFKNKKANIIDGGCGTGGLLSFLRREGFHNLEGFDLSESALTISRGIGVVAIKGDLRQISELYMRNSTDVVICNYTFYFLNMNEQRKLTDEIYLLLRANGLVMPKNNLPLLNYDTKIS